MATAVDGDQFEVWLHGKLKEMNTDQDVFASYIRGILEGDDADDEKLEALEGILVEIATDGSTVAVSHEFLDKWNAFVQARSNNENAAKPDVDAQLATIMEKQAQAVVIEKKSTDVDKEYRDAILLQYSQVSDGEDYQRDEEEEVESKEPGTSVSSSGHASVLKNTNADEIQKVEKDKREKAKAESEKKKAQDKANKEKQKQQQQERKEKEKKRTQKGERKR